MTDSLNLKNGRYRILRKLGEGTLGVVYEAEDTLLGRNVAIKMLGADISTTDLRHRAEDLAKLRHENILQVFDFVNQDGKRYFVSEFVHGQNLRTLIKTHSELRNQLQTILSISMDICAALNYAHSRNLVHGDLKPDNVWIGEDKRAKLVDFGFASYASTNAYMAPEAAMKRATDNRSDLYSLGVVLYEMVTGKTPFTGKDNQKLKQTLGKCPVSPEKLNPRVPQAFAECIMKLLEKNPEKRFQSASEVLKALNIIYTSVFVESLAAEKALIRITIFGAYHPISALKKLERLKSALLRNGYSNTRLLGDYHFQTSDAYRNSQTIISNSDLNLFVFTRDGDKSAVLLELEYAMGQPLTCNRSLVFDEVVEGESSISKLAVDHMKENTKIRRVFFLDERDLFSAAKMIAFSYLFESKLESPQSRDSRQQGVCVR